MKGTFTKAYSGGTSPPGPVLYVAVGHFALRFHDFFVGTTHEQVMLTIQRFINDGNALEVLAVAMFNIMQYSNEELTALQDSNSPLFTEWCNSVVHFVCANKIVNNTPIILSGNHA